MKRLHKDIEQFIVDYKIGVSTFGLLAMNDPHLVERIRKGRELRSATRAKVRAFMAEYKRKKVEKK